MHQIQAEIGIPKIESQPKGENTTVFIMGPLPPGYGMTVGNALRRILLSSIPGTAATGVKIENIAHEYSTIKGVKDSILDICLNLKQLNIKKTNKEPSILTLNISNKEGEIYAKDIKTPSEVEILNPDLYITTIDKKTTKLKMDIRVEKGVGYQQATAQKEEDTGIILIDAIFSPIKNVKYEIEATRVGQMTNLDKLILEIKTNGSITPEDALKFSANILKSYFGLFDQSNMPVEAEFMSDFSKIAQRELEEKQKKPKQDPYTPIEILGLSPRTLNALINGGIGSIQLLVKCTENKLCGLRGFGKKALNEVKAILKNKNLALSTEEKKEETN